MPDTPCLNAMLPRVLLLGALALGGAALPVPARAEVTVAAAAKGYDIAVTDDATATDLIDAITAATGIAVKGQPADDTLPATRLSGVSLERALRGLLPKAAFVVRYGDDGAPAMIIFLTPKDATGAGDAAGSDMQDGSAPDAGSADQPPDGSDTAPDTTPPDLPAPGN